MEEKYHVKAFTQTEEFKRKSAKTKQRRYGNPYYRGKIKNFCRRSLWDMICGWAQYVVPAFNRNEYTVLGATYKWRCQICGNEFHSTIHTTRHINGHEFDRMPRCFHCFPRIHGTSKQESEFIDFCHNFYPNLSEHDKSLIGKELDVVIPELKLAIEYNGLYWHSTSIRNFKSGLHVNKTNLCEKLGYRLIYVWEDDWKLNNSQTREKLIDIFNSNERIPALEKYDRFWYSPLQFKGQAI